MELLSPRYFFVMVDWWMTTLSICSYCIRGMKPFGLGLRSDSRAQACYIHYLNRFAHDVDIEYDERKSTRDDGPRVFQQGEPGPSTNPNHG